MLLDRWNHAHKPHFAEKNAFASSVNGLGIGIKTETPNSSIQFAPLRKQDLIMEYQRQKLKSYVGGVFLVPAKNFDPNAAKEERTTTSILCRADFPGTIKPAEPTYENGKIACGKGTTEVSD